MLRKKLFKSLRKNKIALRRFSEVEKGSSENGSDPLLFDILHSKEYISKVNNFSVQIASSALVTGLISFATEHTYIGTGITLASLISFYSKPTLFPKKNSKFPLKKFA
jgi:hypothetical protein